MDVGITIRDVTEADIRFIYSSWLESYRSSGFVHHIRHRLYYQRHHDLIEAILARPTTRVRVACLRDDPYVIIGWAVTEPPQILHFVYVKKAFQRSGVARALVEELGSYPRIVYTHRLLGEGFRVEKLITKHLSDGLYDPYAAWSEA